MIDVDVNAAVNLITPVHLIVRLISERRGVDDRRHRGVGGKSVSNERARSSAVIHTQGIVQAVLWAATRSTETSKLGTEVFRERKGFRREPEGSNLHRMTRYGHWTRTL